MRLLLIVVFLTSFLGLKSQLSNDIFRVQPAQPSTKWGATFEGLQFLKNNEYFNNINPGVTLFGFQAKGLLHYKLSKDATFSTGLLLQKDFGDAGFLTKAIPLFNFRIENKKWLYNLGNIQPNIQHNLIEPMLNYENLFTQPVEMGVQAKRKTAKMNYDIWLEWKQKLNENTSKQEILVLGQSLENALFHIGSVTLSNPLYLTIFHQGGQALNTNRPIATRINSAAGLRLKIQDTAFLLESFLLNSFDNSNTPTQPYTNGWASMTNLRFRIKKHHQIALTWWYANEFTSTLGNTMFSNVNLKNPYSNNGVRRLAMLRYVYSKPILGSKLWIDFRFEPYYDLDYKKLEFSNGLYFRYVSTLDIKVPRWLGSF